MTTDNEIKGASIETEVLMPPFMAVFCVEQECHKCSACEDGDQCNLYGRPCVEAIKLCMQRTGDAELIE